MGCGSCECGKQILAKNQDGEFYPIQDGHMVIPDYGEPPKIEVKADPKSPLRVVQDENNPACFTIQWDATFNDATRELIASDGKTILFTVPVDEPKKLVGIGGIKIIETNQETDFISLNIDSVNPPDSFTINSSGAIEKG